MCKTRLLFVKSAFCFSDYGSLSPHDIFKNNNLVSTLCSKYIMLVALPLSHVVYYISEVIFIVSMLACIVCVCLSVHLQLVGMSVSYCLSACLSTYPVEYLPIR